MEHIFSGIAEMKTPPEDLDSIQLTQFAEYFKATPRRSLLSIYVSNEVQSCHKLPENVLQQTLTSQSQRIAADIQSSGIFCEMQFHLQSTEQFALLIGSALQKMFQALFLAEDTWDEFTAVENPWLINNGQTEVENKR